MAIRAALGAGRRRLIQQLLTESIVLTSCGALLGLALSIIATRAMAHLTAFNIPLLSSVHVDPGALAFTVLIAIVTGLVLGMAPALQVAAIPLNASLGERGSSQSRTHTWMRVALVVSEIAFACVLLVGAGLLIRSFLRVLDVRMGFRPESAASLRIDPSRQYSTQAQKNAYFDEALRRVKAIPEVQSAGLTDAWPLGHNRAWGAGAKGQAYKDEDYPSAFVRIVSDGYLNAMGISLRKGRDFTPRDTPAATPVIIVNEALAHNLWPGQDPIGQFIQGDCANSRQVVGVVGNVRPLTQLVDRAVSPRRFIVLLLGGFASFALVLASLGIYGVISYSVNRRTQEIGIRMALGASTLHVQGSIVLRTLALAAIGMLAGVAASWALARSLGGLLFGVTYGDPITFLGTAALLLAVAVLAGYLPARRASRIDPMIALRVT